MVVLIIYYSRKGYTKDEIMEYLEEKHIEYRIDKTNFDKKYTRNRYRLDILPVLKNENKNANGRINNLENILLKFVSPIYFYLY